MGCVSPFSVYLSVLVSFAHSEQGSRDASPGNSFAVDETGVSPLYDLKTQVSPVHAVGGGGKEGRGKWAERRVTLQAGV